MPRKTKKTESVKKPATRDSSSGDVLVGPPQKHEFYKVAVSSIETDYLWKEVDAVFPTEVDAAAYTLELPGFVDTNVLKYTVEPLYTRYGGRSYLG